MGLLDAKGDICKKKDQTKLLPKKEKLLLDFGDGFLLNELSKKSQLYPIIVEVFNKDCPALFPLIFYRLAMQSAMYNAKDWFAGNVIQLFFKDVDLSSQNISRILKYLGKELAQRTFFRNYLSQLADSKKAVIIDATSLPNQSNTGFNAWGYSDGNIENQFRLLCVLDQESKEPLFYRYLPGNLSDVSTLQQTIAELSHMGVNSHFALLVVQETYLSSVLK